MNGATRPAPAKRPRRPFPDRSLRDLQELGLEAFAAFLGMTWRPAERREAA